MGARMISGLFLVAVCTVVGGLVGALPAFDAPSFLAADGAVAATVDSAVGYLTPLSGWVPFAHVGVVLAALVACSGVSLAARLARMMISLIPGVNA